MHKCQMNTFPQRVHKCFLAIYKHLKIWQFHNMDQTGGMIARKYTLQSRFGGHSYARWGRHALKYCTGKKWWMLLAGTGGEKKIEIRLNNEEEMANPYQLNRALFSRIDSQFFPRVVLWWKTIRKIYRPISSIVNWWHGDARGTAKRLSTKAGNGKTAYKNCTSLQRVLAHYAG